MMGPGCSLKSRRPGTLYRMARITRAGEIGEAREESQGGRKGQSRFAQWNGGLGSFNMGNNNPGRTISLALKPHW
jgi:hypothetical protein